MVFTNGCFDLLHIGHIALLEQARRMGDRLIVAVNSDRSVRRLKGPERPLVQDNDRARILAALAAVDAVVVFDESTPLRLIEMLRPDVLVKGGDYTLQGATREGFDLHVLHPGYLEGIVPGLRAPASGEPLRVDIKLWRGDETSFDTSTLPK